MNFSLSFNPDNWVILGLVISVSWKKSEWERQNCIKSEVNPLITSSNSSSHWLTVTEIVHNILTKAPQVTCDNNWYILAALPLLF